MYLTAALVYIWGFRLGIYILVRKRGEDWRYKEMRVGYEQDGDAAYWRGSFVVFFAQFIFSTITNSAALFVHIFSKEDDFLWTDVAGAVVWLIGFLIEVFSDSQLQDHLKNPKPGSGKFCKNGFWRYSRHPNYFGEAILWWGIFIIACGLDYGWVTIFAPAFIHWALRYFSGVPYPERKYKDHPEWREYCEETNIFVLMPAKVAPKKEKIELN